MRILLISYYYPPLPGAGSVRPAWMARALQAAGGTVAVLTHTYSPTALTAAELRVCDPAHTRAHRGRGFWPWAWRRAVVEAANRCGVPISIFSSWKREVRRRADEIMAMSRPEVILATYPPVECLEIGLELSRRFGVPLVSDFRDGLLFEPVEVSRLRRYPCVARRYAGVERRAAEESALVMTVSPPIGEYFQRTYNCRRIQTLPNGFDPDEPRDTLPAGFFPPDRVHLVHTGSLGLSRLGVDGGGLRAALHRLGAETASGRRLCLHFVGALSRRERRFWGELADKDMVRFHGPRPRSRALAMQAAADALLLLTVTGQASVATTKLFEYLATGRPILALTAGTWAERIVRECRAGWVVHPADAAEIHRRLQGLVDDPGAERVVDRDMVQRFSRRRQAADLHAWLQEIVHAAS